ncbi:tetratricopeptide repeat protein [Ekhidna sp. To15]|uniref:tetratricopeptide repeat protein n=1 Tax=Ekhidna sp. To15 TaxID=3395267 RepID=UPI003F52693C
MAKGKQHDDGIEILEDPNAIVDKANEFFSSKRNKVMVFGIGGVLALVIVGFAAYNYYITNQDQMAQEELFQAQYYFDADSLGLALNGDGNSYGFLEIMDEFPGTKAANLSSFYAGASYLKLGDFEGAIRNLKKFSSDDYLLQGRAYSLIGDAYMEQDDFANAIGSYEKAVNYKKNESFTPIYLKKLAIAQEQNGNLAAAASTYGSIINDYPNASEVNDAKKQKSRLEALAQ